MAAADYYHPGGSGGGSTFGSEPAQPQNHLPYPVSDAPPPYSPYPNQRPASQPPPHQRPLHAPEKPWPSQYSPQQQQSGGQYYPPQQQPGGHHPQFAPQDNLPPRPSALSNMYRPQDFAAQRPQQPYPAQQGYPPQQGGYYPPQEPAMLSAYDNSRPRPQSGPPPGQQRPASARRRSYSYSRSRSRSRSRARRHHHSHQDSQRPRAQKKKSTGVPSFLGAGGGAIIGDAIFPGLGTLGGAILGGLGGHEYGKQRRSYSDTKDVRRDRHFDREWQGDDHARGRRRDDR